MEINDGNLDESFAREVLNHYEEYLLRCQYVIYIAIVKPKNNYYTLEIGIKSTGINKVNVIENLTDCEIYLGIFDHNTIPNRFPIPSKCDFGIKEHKKTETISIKSHIKRVSKPKFPELASERELLLKRNDNIDKKSYYIYSKKREGTLGGIFKLKKFPQDLFGITNQHFFHYDDVKLGDEIKNNKGNEIGNLYWFSKTINKEAAIIKMNCTFKKNFVSSKESCLTFAQPKPNMIVTHNGYGTAHSDRSSELISSNATVRIKDTDENDDWAVYKNQILIKENTTGGDSGSLVITDKNKVVGLNFNRTHYKKVILGEVDGRNLSVANNINLILNHKFSEKQEVFVKKVKEAETVITTLTDEFKTQNINQNP